MPSVLVRFHTPGAGQRPRLHLSRYMIAAAERQRPPSPASSYASGSCPWHVSLQVIPEGKPGGRHRGARRAVAGTGLVGLRPLKHGPNPHRPSMGHWDHGPPIRRASAAHHIRLRPIQPQACCTGNRKGTAPLPRLLLPVPCPHSLRSTPRPQRRAWHAGSRRDFGSGQ